MCVPINACDSNFDWKLVSTDQRHFLTRDATGDKSRKFI